MQPKQQSILIPQICSWLLILMWTYAATSKLYDHKMFHTQLAAHKLLYPIAGILIWLLPAAEILIVIMLLSLKTQRRGFIYSASLLSVFTLYIVLLYFFDPNPPCSCGGLISLLSWQQHIIFNAIFIIISLIGLNKTFYVHKPVINGH